MTKNFELIEEILIDSSTEAMQTPGQLLRKGREAKKLSVDAVAQQLLLSKQVVNDIDNDVASAIYAKVAPVYIKGYLRAYAKMVGIEEQEVMQAYDNFRQTEGKREVSGRTASQAQEMRHSGQAKRHRVMVHNANKVFFVAIILVILIFGVVLVSKIYNKAVTESPNTTEISAQSQPQSQSQLQPMQSSLPQSDAKY